MKLFKLCVLFAVAALLCSTADAGPLKKLFKGAKKVACIAGSCSR